ncbi:unnamed protein product [Brassica rapa subsp. narinosa]
MAKTIPLPVDGPESIEWDPQGGGPYAAVVDGRILKWRGDGLGWVEFAYTDRTYSGNCSRHEVVPTCGRPLGLSFEKKTGDLYICDGYLGVMKVGPEGGLAELVVDQAEGRKVMFANPMDIDEEDDVFYFNDSSDKYHFRDVFYVIVNDERPGRVIRYNKKTKEAKVVMDNLTSRENIILELVINQTKMCALVPPVFPNFGWPSTGEYESNYLVGENLDDFTFLDFPAPETYGVEHHQEIQEMLGVSVPSEGNGVVTKKLNHNASERDRRKKINSLFSSLRSCLPASDQSKKLSIPQTVSRSLKYIPELQEQMKKLIQKKEELLVRVSGQRDIEHYVEPHPKAVARYVSTISATKLGDNEVMVQISSSKNHNFSISNVLSGLEEDGFVLVDVSSSRSHGERLFYTLHLQMGNKDDYKLTCEELRQRMLYLYEECGNSFR